MKLIIVTGKKQSGKSTTVDFLSKKILQLNKDATIRQYSFADPLKQFLMDVFGLTWEQCNGTDQEKNTNTVVKWKDLPLPEHRILELYHQSHPDVWIVSLDEYLTARQLMQIFGSDICRKMYADCWANATKRKILKEQYIDYGFISDARFPNEIDLFQDLNPTIIRLLRNPYNSSHISETALNNYDFSNAIIVDNTSMELSDKNQLIGQLLSSIL